MTAFTRSSEIRFVRSRLLANTFATFGRGG
jgi:hypothetical protein